MRMTNGIRVLLAATALFALAANALGYDYIVESRSGGKNYSSYSDTGMTGNSTAKSTAPGCTAGIGCRYSTNSVGTATYRFVPLWTGDYTVYASWAISSSGDTSVPHVASHDGGTTSVNFNQSQAGGLYNAWQQIGATTIHLTRGVEYTVVQSNPTQDGGTGRRLQADSVKWTAGIGNCYDVGAVEPKPPVAPGDMTVTVQGVNVAATEVRVYEYDPTVTPETNVLIGSGPNDIDGGDVAVALSSAVKSTHQLKATQVVGGYESCLPFTGMQITCDQVPVVQPKVVLVSGDTSVVVTGVRADAASVKVYSSDGVTATLIGTTSSAPVGGEVTVPTQALIGGRTIFATQVLGTLEGCTTPQPPGIVVNDCNQVAAVAISGLLDAGRTAVYVNGVSASATAVKVYANDGATDNLIGTNNSPTAGLVAVTVSPLVAGQTIKATQVVRLESCMPANGAAGTRVALAAGTIEDFQGTNVASDNFVPTTYERTWYDVGQSAWSDAYFPTGLLASRCMRILDGGTAGGTTTNGVYAVYENIIPANAAPGQEYHLQVEMLLDENTADGSPADPNQINNYQFGVVVNGAHRTASTTIASITAPIGIYTGIMTPDKNGLSTGEGSYQVLGGTFTADPGDSLLIAFSSNCNGYAPLAVPASGYGRAGMLVDNIKLNVGPKPCGPEDVPLVSVTSASDDIPLEAGKNQVRVIGINDAATQVDVYEFTPPSTWDHIGGGAVAGATEALVTLTRPLVAHKIIVATQSMIPPSCPGQTTAVEGRKLTSGPIVGTAKNSPLKVAIGVREVAVPGTGCNPGDDGTNSGPIEWIGVTAAGSPPQGSLTLSPSGTWQTISFDPSVAAEIKSFNAGDGILNGACYVLEHLALTATGGNTGSYTLYIDNIDLGGLTVDFEDGTEGNVYMFRTPNYSGTTSTNLLNPPAVAKVTSERYDGATLGKSLKVKFEFKDEATSRWLRLTTDSTGLNQTRANPIVSIAQPITMRVLFEGQTCNNPFADVDNDGDVDQTDFAAMQFCYSGPGVAMPPGCGCFDTDSDNDVDSDDNGKFELCASGPGVAANPACDD